MPTSVSSSPASTDASSTDESPSDEPASDTSLSDLPTPEALRQARDCIDTIDRRLVELLAERQAVVDEVCEIKSASDRPTKDADREARLLERIGRHADRHGLSPEMVQSLFEHIIAHSVGRQNKQRRGTTDASPRAQLLRLLDDAA